MSTIYEYLQLAGRSNKTKTLAESVNSKDPQIYEDSATRSAAAKVAFRSEQSSILTGHTASQSSLPETRVPENEYSRRNRP